jgi:Asp-tRNA(Asn)/Glu-tRNA(Gln) amidotransferase A subunit family amidase
VYREFGGGPDLIAAGNLAGWPALTVPSGLAESQLPAGIAFLGDAFSEAKLLSIGKRFQQRSVHHAAHPELLAAPPT